MSRFVNLGLIVLNVIFAVSGQLAIKAGMKQVGVIDGSNLLPMLLRSFLNPLVVLGLAAYIGASVLWILVLSRVELSYAYPLLSLGYIAILILGVTVLKESVSFARVAGTFLIIAGVVLIYRS